MNPNIVAIKWSPQIAYAVGLIVTDGNLSSDGRHFDFTSKDVELVKIFKRCLNINNKIGLKSAGKSNKKYHRVQFGNSCFYRQLLDIGITPNKTKTIGFLQIPDEFFFDFLRGHFDGDGSCYGYWDKRWKSSFMFYMKFVSASKSHIYWLQAKIRATLGINGAVGKAGFIYQLSYAKKESRVLSAKMYYGGEIPCLKRKFEKLQKLLEIDKNPGE
ncbi:MAG TPA: hypothetical protein PLA19_05260 [Candidatus Pacearchaeota archaeon]|jgi:hypothetical protein|nr:hypothetical protein [Candidatus Pacearchaeota archaeon]